MNISIIIRCANIKNIFENESIRIQLFGVACLMACCC